MKPDVWDLSEDVVMVRNLAATLTDLVTVTNMDGARRDIAGALRLMAAKVGASVAEYVADDPEPVTEPDGAQP